MRILVIDDDENARVYLSDLLEAQGYTVVSATNGREGLEAATASPPDLIISDIMMPGMDGFELCRRIKSDERLKEIPFVFYSATYTEAEDQRLAMKLEASRFIIKPKEADELIEELREVIEEHEVDRLPALARPDRNATTLDGMHLEVVNRKLQKKIREQEQTARALSESEAVLKATLESTKDGVLVVSRDGTVSHCNARFQEIWSIPPEVMATRSDRKLIEFVLPQLAAPDEFVAKINEIYQGSGTLEDTIRLKDGRVFERFSSPHVQEGRETGRVWFFRDITERERVEKALRTSEQRFRATFNQTFQLMGLLDLDGTLLTVNNTALEMIGAEEKVVIGKPFWETPWWTHSPEAQAKLQEAIKRVGKGESVRYETSHPQPDGQDHLIDFSLKPILGEDHQIEYLCAEGHDITSKRSAQEKLQEMEHQISHVSRLSAMGEMVAGIAHEVNQPLYSIVNYAKACANLLAKDGEPDLQQVSTWTEKIASAATRAGKIVSRMREFVSRRPAQMERVGIAGIVTETVELLAFELRHSGAALTTAIPGQLPEIHADRVQMQQVLVNLVRNAVEAVSNIADGERKVAIQVEVEGEFLRVSVLDNGPGLPDPDDVALFEPFETTKPDGLGMGLAISRTIVENHDGELWAENGPDGGAAFRFTLALPSPLPRRQSDAG